MIDQPSLRLAGQKEASQAVNFRLIRVQEAGLVESDDQFLDRPISRSNGAGGEIVHVCTALVDVLQNPAIQCAEWLVFLILLLCAAKVLSRGFKRGLKIFYLRVRVLKLRLKFLKLRLKLFHRDLKGRYLMFRLNRTLAALKRVREKAELRKRAANLRSCQGTGGNRK